MLNILFLALSLFITPAHAQNTTCANRPVGDSSNACANTRFVDTAAAAAIASLAIVDVAKLNTPIVCNGTDQTTNLTAAFAQYPNGATFQFHQCTYLFSSKITIPNDGAGSFPKQQTYTLSGSGSYGSAGQSDPATPHSGTVFQLTGTDPWGMIQTYGSGTLTLTHLSLYATDCTTTNPILLASLTKVLYPDVGFYGSPSCPGKHDAVVFGAGLELTFPGDHTAAWQGEGSSGSYNFYNYIRRAAVGGLFSNGVSLTHQVVWTGSTNLMLTAGTVSIVSAGTNCVSGNAIYMSSSEINGGAIVIVDTVDGSGHATSAHLFWGGAYVSAPSNPVSAVMNLTNSQTGGTKPSNAYCTDLTVNLGSFTHQGAAFDNVLPSSSNWYVQTDLLDFQGYYFGYTLGNGNAYVILAPDDVNNGGVTSLGGIHVLNGAGYSYLSPGGSVAGWLGVVDDNVVSPAVCSTNFVVGLSGDHAEYSCVPYVGVAQLTVGPGAASRGGVLFQSGSASPVTIQPFQADGGSSTQMIMKRSAGEGVNPGATIFQWNYDGSSTQTGAASAYSFAASSYLSGSLAKVANGQAAAPSLTFTSDTTTGIYLIGAGRIALSAGGVAAHDIQNNGGTTQTYAVGNGTGASTAQFSASDAGETYLTSVWANASGSGGMQMWHAGVTYDLPLYLQPNGGSVKVGGDYTLANLNTQTALKFVGSEAHVIDATICSYRVTVTDGGGVYCKVMWNGANWEGH